MPAKTFRVVRPIEHNQRRFEPGELIELEDHHVKRLPDGTIEDVDAADQRKAASAEDLERQIAELQGRLDELRSKKAADAQAPATPKGKEKPKDK